MVCIWKGKTDKYCMKYTSCFLLVVFLWETGMATIASLGFIEHVTSKVVAGLREKDI